jgi:hypothetical protein
MSAVWWLSEQASVRQAAVAVLEQRGAPAALEQLLDANVGALSSGSMITG